MKSEPPDLARRSALSRGALLLAGIAVTVVSTRPAKAKAKLGWAPKTSFDQLVTEMVNSDYELAQRDALVRAGGFKILNHNE